MFLSLSGDNLLLALADVSKSRLITIPELPWLVIEVVFLIHGGNQIEPGVYSLWGGTMDPCPENPK